MIGQSGVVFLIRAVQRVIGAFDKNFAPLNQAGGEEAGDDADQEYLEKG
jgi:hypothetical protein